LSLYWVFQKFLAASASLMTTFLVFAWYWSQNFYDCKISEIHTCSFGIFSVIII